MDAADFDHMTREELKAHLLEQLREVSDMLPEVLRHARKRPLLGGAFGAAGYVLCSSCFVMHGLQEVRYFVASEHGLCLGVGSTKAAAIDMARTFLAGLDPHERSALLSQYRSRSEALAAEQMRALIEAERLARDQSQEPKVKSMGRRRQRIFDESEGKCHYCGTVLVMDGKWHIEHKMPRALGGDSDPGNLVAACVPCNMKKRDTTDVEFKAKLAKEK